MAYFLKKTNRKDDVYLQIYFSFRDPDTKKPKNKCHKSLGYLSKFIENGMADPIAHFQDEVDQLNIEFRTERESRKVKQVGDISPQRNIGYFPCASVLRRLDVKDDIETLASTRNFQFSVYECLKSLIFARLIAPASKHRTLHEVFPLLWESADVSYDQILSCLDFIGNEYEKFVEMFYRHTDEVYILDTKRTYFDCTNFYFEIDREDEWRRKGPSKENRHDPILGMGLLLEANLIPAVMRLYPGNQSEKPVLRQSINDLKKQHGIEGRTISVADKGLNCAANIYKALSEGDGYIFSKSVKQLSEVERTWALNPEGFVPVSDPDQPKEKFRIKSCVDTFSYEFVDENGKKVKFSTKEKRIVTYNPSLARKQTAEIYKMVEKARRCCLSQAKKSEYGESAKYVNFRSLDENGEKLDRKAGTEINQEKIDKDLQCAGFNMIVTSETEMDNIEIYRVYHELWRIEETFRTMKSELDARPVYLQSINRIKGHFLICYLSVLLERLVQFKVFENRFGSSQVYSFMRKFIVTPYSNKEHLNLVTNSDILDFIYEKYNLPVKNYYLRNSEIKKILEKSL